MQYIRETFTLLKIHRNTIYKTYKLVSGTKGEYFTLKSYPQGVRNSAGAHIPGDVPHAKVRT